MPASFSDTPSYIRHKDTKSTKDDGVLCALCVFVVNTFFSAS